MKRTIRIPRLLCRSRAFAADAKGLAAIELALILPIALMLMSLVVFGGRWPRPRSPTFLPNTSTITAAELNQILSYPSLVLYPYNGSTASVVVSQVQVMVNGNGTAAGTVCGSWANANGTPRAKGTQMSVDPSISAAFSGPGSNSNCDTTNLNYVVLGEVSYPFQATGIYFSVGTFNLHDSIIMIPRVASPITVQ
jgi:Flp pilus assembly protein TadG